MAPTRAYYVVYAALPDGTIEPAADLGLETDARGRHIASAVRYRSDWLRHPQRFALNPVHVPLQSDAIEWETRELPALIDEVCPGRWERAVLARMWQRMGAARDLDDLHAILSAPRRSFRVGAVEIGPADAPPPRITEAIDVAEIDQLAQVAGEVVAEHDPEIDALQRLQAGSSVGGARPKVIVRDGDGVYLAKLTRADDRFNHARVEHVCLELARRAGIAAPASRVIRAGRSDALLVERFDVAEEGGRYHLVSANALLKDAATQADRWIAAYEDLVTVIRRYSDQPAADLRQLFAQMLLNRTINNLDDHLRNFSFRAGPDGFRLSPAYDLVPSEAVGGYPNLGFGSEPAPPGLDRPERLHAAGRRFALRKAEVDEIVGRLQEALRSLPELLAETGVSEADQRLLRRVMRANA
ncbi:MAG: type II toxin-antitoxin system HipA family toxin [Halochromatium sp.]|uniref:type II toxin-antitoxin system HipA family toxin n=1 Tax=Halochromatium sp. TaxID=2049430 RepID=UPI00397B4F67